MPIEKGLFRVCGKTGRVVGFNRQWRWFNWFLPLVGLLALLWYLMRVIPKPSRAAYPCQQVGVPLALGGLSYLLSLFGLVVAFRKARQLIGRHRYAVAGICLVIVFICAAVVIKRNEGVALAADTGTFTPADVPNHPVGTARGIHPGRVAWAYDLNACNWDGTSSYWFSTNFNDQTKISAMLDKVINSVAGQPTVSNSWDALFRFKNGGIASYVKGEKIAIKINLNNGGKNQNMIDASPQSVYALLDGLVNRFGANQTDITICDPARENQCSVVSNYCRRAFPNVNYDSNLGGFTANAFAYSAAGPTETSLSTTIVNTKYLIVLAVLKRHCTPAATFGTDGVDYGNASVSLIFKSNWGIIGNNRAKQHSLLHDWAYTMASYNQLVDILGSTNIDGKTVINLIDGLYSANRWNSQPYKWQMAPFNNHWPCSFFASQDPVAIESVCFDFFRSEMPLIKNGDRHLFEAAQANNPPSGTVYQPNGVRLSSLGVHEYWNDATNKQYSRNLGTGPGIELVTILPNNFSVAITNPSSGSSFPQGGNLTIQAGVLNAPNPISQVAFYQGTNFLGAATGNPYGIIWSNAPPGNWAVTAVATDTAGLSATSNPVNIGIVTTNVIAPVSWDADPVTPGAQDGGGIWNLTSPNWWNGVRDIAWPPTAPANTTFGTATAAAGSITLGATGITLSNLTFNPAASGDYTIVGGGYALVLVGSPNIAVAANCAPAISAPLTGTGFTKTGSGLLNLNSANSYNGLVTINDGTLALNGDNSATAGGVTVAAGATLLLAHSNAVKSALTLNSGATLQLRADADTTFAPVSIALQNTANILNFNINSASGATGKTMGLPSPLAFAGSLNQTINVTGGNGYTLGLGAITATATSHNPYWVVNVNAIPGINATVAAFTAGNYGTYLNLAGGGKVTVAGNLGNASNGSVITTVNNGTTATLQGSSVKSGSGDAYRYYVPNGTLILDNSSAVINNTTGAGLNSSQFILGAATNIYAGVAGVSPPTGLLVTANNNYNCAVYLGDANYPNGGLTLAATATNYVSDGDVGFVNSGTMTIGGQNASGINTFANPIILGWTANQGKRVTLVAATGGEVDFTGGLRQNGTDTTAGVTVGDGAHGGTVKFTSANTYAGGTTVANGKLLINGSLAAGAVNVQSGAMLGGTGTINGPVTIQSGGTLAPGNPLGVLTLNSNLTLAGNLLININKSASPAYGSSVVGGVLTNAGNGILTVVNSGPALGAGDRFSVFNQAMAHGESLNISPPIPGPGLVWANKLAINGSLGVVAVATNSPTLTALYDGNHVYLSWPADHTGWRLQVQTNSLVTGLGTNWTDLPSSSWVNSITNPVADGGSVFYRLWY